MPAGLIGGIGVSIYLRRYSSGDIVVSPEFEDDMIEVERRFYRKVETEMQR